ncbi:MAG TPA: colanic acid biosynthesis glycosyltransferase WcaL, partial [Opitutaceae bacterium]|nr:colanic acid biosynthesis glycosyltransferase WcaL [Opitutaceae bacterium]
MNKTPPTIAYLFTTFPKPTETFLQREVIAMIERGAQLRLYSLWGGGGSFRGVRVRTFPKWKLLTLIWMIPYTAVRWPKLMWELIVGLWT